MNRMGLDSDHGLVAAPLTRKQRKERHITIDLHSGKRIGLRVSQRTWEAYTDVGAVHAYADVGRAAHRAGVHAG